MGPKPDNGHVGRLMAKEGEGVGGGYCPRSQGCRHRCRAGIETGRDDQAQEVVLEVVRWGKALWGLSGAFI